MGTQQHSLGHPSVSISSGFRDDPFGEGVSLPVPEVPAHTLLCPGRLAFSASPE